MKSRFHSTSNGENTPAPPEATTSNKKERHNERTRHLRTIINFKWDRVSALRRACVCGFVCMGRQVENKSKSPRDLTCSAILSSRHFPILHSAIAWLALCLAIFFFRKRSHVQRDDGIVLTLLAYTKTLQSRHPTMLWWWWWWYTFNRMHGIFSCTFSTISILLRRRRHRHIRVYVTHSLHVSG